MIKKSRFLKCRRCGEVIGEIKRKTLENGRWITYLDVEGIHILGGAVYCKNCGKYHFWSFSVASFSAIQRATSTT